MARSCGSTAALPEGAAEAGAGGAEAPPLPFSIAWRAPLSV
jgi:hypothetical protein